jgi:hypothetical protein
MTFAGIGLGVVLAVAVAAGLALLPIGPDPLRPLRRAGRGSRKWWILAAALSLLLGEAAGRSSVSHSFAILVLAVVVVPSLLACGWAWVRARSFS